MRPPPRRRLRAPAFTAPLCLSRRPQPRRLPTCARPAAAAAPPPPRAAGGEDRQGPPDASARGAAVTAGRLRKAGDLRGAREVLVGYVDGASTAVLNEMVYVAVAERRARGAGALELLRAAWDVVRGSRAGVNSRTYNAVLSALTGGDGEGDGMGRALLRAGLDVARGMGEVQPDSYTMSLVFQLCAGAGDADAAERYCVACGGEAALDAVSGAALVAAYAKMGDVARAEAAFRGLVERGVRVNERTYAAVISAYHRARLHGKVVAALDDALRCPAVRLNWFVFSGALASCARVGDAENARRFFGKLLSAGVRPTEDALGCVLDAAVRGGDVVLARDVLYDWMRKRRMAPTRDQVNKVIALCGRVGVAGGGGREGVMRVLETMTSDLGVAPDLGTYNTAISALGRTRNMATARYLVEHRFPLLGLKPNVFTFNALIHACGVVGNAHAAFELMHRMRGAAVMPNQVTFSTLLEQCVRAREPELVAHVLADMERTRGVTLDSKSVSSLLEMFRARRDAPSAIAAVQRAVREGGAAALDTAAFNALVTICLDWGARDHAVGVVGMLLAAGRADAGTFNAVIERSGVREKNPARAAEVFSAMKARGVAPNDVTYSTMIRACAQNGQLERAFRLLAEMQDVGLGASDTYAWTAVIDGCGRSGQGSRAVEILDYMRGGGGAASSSAPGLALHGLVPAPNTATYNAALYAAGVGGGGWPAAWRVYELMRADSGAQPDHITYSSLASALLDNRQVVCDVAQVEAVAAGLREAAARVQREKPASKGATRSKAQTLKRIAAKVSRVDWLAETLRRGSGADDGAVGRRAVSVAQTERCDGDREESVAESVGD